MAILLISGQAVGAPQGSIPLTVASSARKWAPAAGIVQRAGPGPGAIDPQARLRAAEGRDLGAARSCPRPLEALL